MSALTDLIASLESSSPTDKGTLFEDICLHFLQHDKLNRSQFSRVWKWHDFPLNDGRPDTGIDIVAQRRTDNTYCAIQCKYRSSDTPITKAEIDSFLAASSKPLYSERIIISTTANYGRNALDTITGQTPPVRTLTLPDLERSIDWAAWPDNLRYITKTLRPDQLQAVSDVISGLNHHDRGKLLMACGTGKTFTSLKIAESFCGAGGVVLFLVPSISLLNQSLLAWNNDASCPSADRPDNLPLISFAVCSDKTVGKNPYPDEDLKLSDLSCPPTTDAAALLRAWHALTDSERSQSLTVIFCTYQSAHVIHDAQAQGFPAFDLMICDEAHRTAGNTPENAPESYFRKVHDDTFILSRKRLYMTATPKIFTENLKAKAKDDNILLCSMDDTNIYGPVFHWLTFSKAVEQDLLSDYKVIIFMAEKEHDDEPDIITIIKGAYKALAKDISPDDFDFIENDTQPMQRAVAFSSTINGSKDFARLFTGITDSYTPITCKTQHIDGTTSAAKRSSSLQWLNSPDESECRILSNARCLCEGVDVPALDAVIFISPKTSEIDVVQSVGRVMRKAPGKKYGYVILPVIVKPNEDPIYALDHNDSYRTVWRVLQALRAHDDHFSAEINSLDFGARSKKVRAIRSGDRDYTSWFTQELADRYSQEIAIRMVRKCGDREYWPSWVADLVNAFNEISRRITHAITDHDVKRAFEDFTDELRAAINPSITTEQAVEMLAQHITSKEVFDAIFTGFAAYNPVSQSMQKIRAELEAHGADLDPAGLEKFNEHVRDKAKTASTGEAKQKLLRSIYENFFAQAFSDTAKNLGIVYTPEEIVDFIIRSADWAARSLLHIPEGLSAEGVHILDPFSGTGTFTARLIESGIIPVTRLQDKYLNEIHANEILLLAYYISAVNIEAAYTQAAGGFYTEFPGMVLADTFRLNEDRTPYLHKIFNANGERADIQEKAEVRVIIGNPPYSVGGRADIYKALDGSIKATYAKKSRAKFKGSVYDSYIRAIRWASDRIGSSKGIICFVTNGAFIDSNSADGMRKQLAEDFTHIFIFNLRGNANTSGEIRRKERGNVFGEGTRCSVAVTLLVKTICLRQTGSQGLSASGRRAEIRYYAAGDYMTREEKLEELVRLGDFGRMMGHLSDGRQMMERVEPNAAGDWVNQRSGEYEAFVNLGNKNEPERAALFEDRYSAGAKTGHDAYSCNFSRDEVCTNIKRLFPNAVISDDTLRVFLHRPYVKEYLHFSRETIQAIYQVPAIFPKHDTKNLAIYVSGIGACKSFSVLMTDCIPNLHLIHTGQCFPLYWYEGQSREDGISDSGLSMFREHYGDGTITKEEVFYYIYGVLSSREYATRFGNDTRRLLARVPMVPDRERFGAFSAAGRELGLLHVGYEGVEPYPVRTTDGPLVMSGLPADVQGADFRVSRMRVVSESGERVIRYNDGLTLRGIPAEAWGYEVNGRSALEWVVERYRDSVDAASGIRNDCNAWGAGYVLGLLGRVVRVSVESVRILGGMPELGV